MGLSYPNVRDKEDQSPRTTIDLIVELRERLSSKGLDHRPQTIAWHLAHHHEKVVPVNSVHRHLRGAGHVIAVPYKRLRPPRSALLPSYPNERWQANFTHCRLADGAHAEILCLIDDPSVS